MDTKIPTHGPVPQVPQSPVADSPSPQSTTSSPAYVSGGNKEHAPLGRVSEFVTPHHTEVAPEIPTEVKEAGVEASPSLERPQIEQEAQQLGVQPAKENVPVVIADQVSVQAPLPTPMNYTRAEKESQGSPYNSNTWLAMLSKYVLERLGLQNAA